MPELLDLLLREGQSSSRCGLGCTAGPAAGITPGFTALGDSISFLTGSVPSSATECPCHQQVTREPVLGNLTPDPPKAGKTLQNVFLKRFLLCQALRDTKAIKQRLKGCLTGPGVESPKSGRVKCSHNCSLGGTKRGGSRDLDFLSGESTRIHL